MKTELAKLAYLRRLDAHTLDLSMLPAERRRFLVAVGCRLTGQALSRREPERRYPILLALLAESAVDVLDEVVFLFDQAISGRESAAKTCLSEALAEHARQGEDRQVLLDEILAIALDPGLDLHRNVLLPGVTTLARLVARERDAATQRLWDSLYAALTVQQRAALDALLVVPPGGRVSELERWRAGPARPSARRWSGRCTGRGDHRVGVVAGGAGRLGDASAAG